MKVSRFRVRCVKAPLPKPHKTASGTVAAAPLVLLDLETDAGIVGCSYVFVYTPLALRPVAAMVAELEALVAGQDVAPAAVTRALQARFRLLGNQGLVGIAIAAVDMAMWDALAKAHGLPLARLLGGAPRPSRVYDSLGQMPPDETAREVEASLKGGFQAFKIKAGHPEVMADAAVLRAMREVGGEGLWIAADFNQAFQPADSIGRMRVLDAFGLAWIEEPARAEDHAGHAVVRRAIATEVQTGENWWGLPDMTASIAAGASGLVMPDVMKIGGVTGWLEAAALANAHGLPLSAHLFPEISAHLLAVTPTAHMAEWLDVASAINETPPTVKGGMLHPADAPGAGLAWNERAVAELAA